MKYEFGGQIMKQFFGLRTKIYSYSKHSHGEWTKEKGTKKCVVKKTLNLKIIKNA